MAQKNYNKLKQIGVGGADMGARERAVVMDVLKSQRLSYGPYCKKFEHDFSARHGCRFGVMMNSGTSVLHAAIATLKEVYRWKDGDEVLCPSLTFVATSNMVIMNNLKPVFVDIDAREYNMDPALIEAKITPRTRAIVVVHLFGQSARMDVIMKIARAHKLRVIEDSCETVFASYNNRSVGSWGDISCFSTYVAHVLITGVGGVGCTNNPRYYELMRSFINHGRDASYISMDDDKKSDPRAVERVIMNRFVFRRIGHSFRVSELEGALGVAQLERAEKIVAARRAHVARLRELLKPYEKWVQLPTWPVQSQPVYMVFPMVLQPDCGFTRRDIILFLEQRGIETREMMPLLNQPAYKKLFGNIEKKYPVAQWINSHGFYIGCHPKIGAAQLRVVAQAFKEFFAAQK